MSQIVCIYVFFGIIGKLIVVGYICKDLLIWVECLLCVFIVYGVGCFDIFQVFYGYGLFMGGLGVYVGVENIGVLVIFMLSGNMEKQIILMYDFGLIVLCCILFYVFYLVDVINDLGFLCEEFKLKVGVFGVEFWMESMCKDIEIKLGIKVYDIYGLSEIVGFGVGYECECQNGMYLNEDYFFFEIIDLYILQFVEFGQIGEFVFIYLMKEGMFLLCYRIKDLMVLYYEKCFCGCILVCMDCILGCSDDMFIICGVNVFLIQIEFVILEMVEFELYYLLIIDCKNNMDIMELKVEVCFDYYLDEINKMLVLKKKLIGCL